jgi:hypothetical protein
MQSQGDKSIWEDIFPSESKGMVRVLFQIFLYYPSDSESTVPHIYTIIKATFGIPVTPERPL